MLQKSSELEFNDHLFECLFKAVSIENQEVKTSEWCKFDDVVVELLTQIGKESNLTVSILLIQKLVKFCALSFTIKHIELSDISTDELESYYDELRSMTNLTNYRTMRWNKRLMEMMITESPKLMSDSIGCLKLLHMFHCIYIISISNTEPEILGQQLTDFTKKIILLLLQASRTHKSDKFVAQSVILFLKTIQQHQRSNQGLHECIHKVINFEGFNYK